MTNLNTKSKSRGFTIVELLVVIVVIGILAAISIVSYTGVTNKANTTKSLTNAESAQNLADVLFAETSMYPARIINSGVSGSYSNINTSTADAWMAAPVAYTAATIGSASVIGSAVNGPTTVKLPAGVTVVPGKAKAAGAAGAESGATSLNANNGGTTLSWSCRTDCATNAVTEGGRIGYWDYSAGTIAYTYVGQAVQADAFTTPTR